MSTTPRRKMRRGLANETYKTIVDQYASGKPFTADDIAKRVRVERWQGANAINYIVSLPQQFPGVERLSRGMFRYVPDRPVGDVAEQPHLIEIAAAPKRAVADPPQNLIMLRLLAESDGRHIAIDDDTEDLYWVEQIV